MKRAVIGGIALATSLVMSLAEPSHSRDNEPVDTIFPRGLPWAVTEDACLSTVKRCVWHAPSRGNGKGRSYILVRFRGDFLVNRVDHDRARFLAQAYCDRPAVQDCEVR